MQHLCKAIKLRVTEGAMPVMESSVFLSVLYGGLCTPGMGLLCSLLYPKHLEQCQATAVTQNNFFNYQINCCLQDLLLRHPKLCNRLFLTSILGCLLEQHLGAKEWAHRWPRVAVPLQ